MISHRFKLLLAVTLTACSANAVLAQSNSGVVVAVLDVGRVFKEHVRFSREMEAIKADVKAFQAEVNSKRKSLVERAQQLTTQYKQGTPEFDQLDAKLAKDQSQIQLQLQLKQKGFFGREAKLYYDTYQEIRESVARVSERYRISLVLRFDSQPIDSSNVHAVQSSVNRFVVWQKNVDITTLVIEDVNGRQARR